MADVAFDLRDRRLRGMSLLGQTRRFRRLAKTSASPLVSDVVGLA
jgi:hypothetical protein